jgi:hypothetical protein
VVWVLTGYSAGLNVVAVARASPQPIRAKLKGLTFVTKCALICGAGGFIGSHLVKRLKRDGLWVCGVDLKFPEFSATEANGFVIGDLRDRSFCSAVIDRRFDEVHPLAADMGGCRYTFTGEHDADVMHNSATINFNVLDGCRRRRRKEILYSPSACIYPAYNQTDPSNPNCSEASAYPAPPDSEYGWDKLFSERLYMAYRRNHGMHAHVARYHNIFGPEGTWMDGRERPLLRSVARLPWLAAATGSRSGARQPNPLVPLHRRVQRRRGAAHAFKLPLPSQHRIGGNAFDPSFGRSRRVYCQQTDRQKAYSRTAGSARAQVGQQTHQGELKLAADAAVARGAGEYLSVDRAAGETQFDAAPRLQLTA